MNLKWTAVFGILFLGVAATTYAFGPSTFQQSVDEMMGAKQMGSIHGAMNRVGNADIASMHEAMHGEKLSEGQVSQMKEMHEKMHLENGEGITSHGAMMSQMHSSNSGKHSGC